ncbi:outer membrane protein [Prosthecodimorpha staleyi]|uniref:Outer membrane beta-barrel protein n=1 Tax=Prosthecodimorpha staleyi TaxID=2840188 RepID=A0A947GIH8_9HYPH|nr:outer membrane beta-barrel protein [Prosthecodimorpha staleyi]MBT9289594.1 outer membrane beta-barrel protein [Prosthecodimorpha staleyi]
MNRLSTFLVTAAAAMILSDAAGAVDLFTKTASATPACAAARFGGFYAGVNAGGMVQKSDFTDVDYFWYGGTKSYSAQGATAGVQAGYNYVFCNTLVGFEVDANWANASSKKNFTTYSTQSSSIDWFGTARLRAGFAVDNFLLYGTGGLAWGDIKSGWDFNKTYWFPDADFKKLNTLGVGWVAGAGIEYAVTDKISIKAEGLYMDLGSKTGRTNPYDVTYKLDVATTAAVARLGVNVRY